MYMYVQTCAWYMCALCVCAHAVPSLTHAKMVEASQPSYTHQVHVATYGHSIVCMCVVLVLVLVLTTLVKLYYI